MHRIGLVVFPGFQMIGLTALTVFELANATLRLSWSVPAFMETETQLLDRRGFGQSSARQTS
jgi:hypothetical protein